MSQTKKVALIVSSAYALLFLAWACDSQPNGEQPLPHGVSVESIDSCEYIIAYGGVNRNVAIVHKANCRNHGGRP